MTPSKETIHEGTTKSTCYTDLNCTRAVYIDDGVCFTDIIFTPTVKKCLYGKRDFRPEEHPKRTLKLVSFNSILESPQTILPQFGGGVGGGGQRESEDSYRPRRRPRAGQV